MSCHAGGCLQEEWLPNCIRLGLDLPENGGPVTCSDHDMKCIATQDNQVCNV
jgi:hypothetical protein